MPTYNAKCPKCGKEEEYITSISRKLDDLPECSSCKVSMESAWISPKGGFVLKGGGWHKKEYPS